MELNIYKMKQLLAVLFLLFVTSTVNSQLIKTYSGDYPNEYGGMGKATYSYYEDKESGNNIKHGNFKYTMKEGERYIAVFKGNFKNGKRDGLWHYIITRLDDSGNDNAYYTGTIEMTSNYFNGLPTGFWTYSKTMRYRSKVFNNGSYSWTNYKIEPQISASANFKLGIPVGLFKIVNGDYEYSSIIGNFDQNGFLDKTWIFRSNTYEIVRTFNKGIQTSYVSKKFPSGTLERNSFDDDEMSKYKKDILENKITSKDLLDKRIVIDTLSAIDNNLYSFDLTFYSTSFNYQNITGDETYNSHLGGYYFIFNKLVMKSISQIENEYGLSYISNDASEYVIEKYNIIVTNEKQNLSVEDFAILKNKIISLRKSKELNERKKEYHDIENLHKNSNNEFEKCIELSNQFLKKYENVLTSSEIQNITSVIQDCIIEKRNFDNNTNRNKIYSLQYRINDSLINFNRALSWKYELGNGNEKISIYENYKSIKVQFEIEKNSITNGFEYNRLSNEKISQLLSLHQDFIFIVKFINSINNSRLDSKIEKLLKSKKTISEIRDLFENFNN